MRVRVAGSKSAGPSASEAGVVACNSTYRLEVTLFARVRRCVANLLMVTAIVLELHYDKFLVKHATIELSDAHVLRCSA